MREDGLSADATTARTAEQDISGGEVVGESIQSPDAGLTVAPNQIRDGIEAAVADIADAFGLQGEEYAPMRQEIRNALEQGINNPDVQAIADQMGIALPNHNMSDAAVARGAGEESGSAADALWAFGPSSEEYGGRRGKPRGSKKFQKNGEAQAKTDGIDKNVFPIQPIPDNVRSVIRREAKRVFDSTNMDGMEYGAIIDADGNV